MTEHVSEKRTSRNGKLTLAVAVVATLAFTSFAVWVVPAVHAAPASAGAGPRSDPLTSSVAAGAATVSYPVRPAASPSDPVYGVLGSSPLLAAPMKTVYDPVVAATFTSDFGAGSVSVYSDAVHHVVANVSVLDPIGVAYDSAKGEIFVASHDFVTGPPPVVAILSDRTDTVVANVQVGFDVFGTPNGAPTALAYDAGRGQIWATVPQFGNVTILSDATNSIVTNLSVGNDPVALAYDSGRGEMFVVDFGSHLVNVYADATDRLITNISVGTDPDAIAYDAATGYVYVGNEASGNVSVISDATNRVVATVPVGQDPYDITVAWPGTVVVANALSSNLSVISDATNTVVATVAIGAPVTNFTSAVTFDAGEQVVVAVDGVYDALWYVAPEFGISFNETGLPFGTFWALQFSGSTGFSSFDLTVGSANAGIPFLEPRGVYAFSVQPELGFATSPAAGTVVVANGPVSQPVTFAPLYTVTFQETGLPAGTAWSVILGGVQVNSTGTSAVFADPNGKFGYLALAPGWTATSGGSGTLVVAGGPLTVAVSFAAEIPKAPGPAPVQVSTSGYTSADMAAIGIGAAGLALGLVAVVLALRKRPPSP
jgi:YVTN family beta-propeller protein